MLTTLSVPTSGTGRVAGFDILREPNEVRRSMGLTGQAATVDEILTGRENLKLIGALYGLPKKYVREATERLFDRFDLTDAADRMAKTYSGGMRRRLDLAVSLLAASRRSCSSTSRPPGWTRRAGPACGRSSGSSSTRARRWC